MSDFEISRGRPSKNEVLGRVSFEEARNLSGSYHSKKLIFNESRTETFTRSTIDIDPKTIEQFNYFLSINERRAKLIDKIHKISKEFLNIDNLEADILFY